MHTFSWKCPPQKVGGGGTARGPLCCGMCHGSRAVLGDTAREPRGLSGLQKGRGSLAGGTRLTWGAWCLRKSGKPEVDETRDRRETTTPLTEQPGSKPHILLWDGPETQFAGETQAPAGPRGAQIYNQHAKSAESRPAPISPCSPLSLRAGTPGSEPRAGSMCSPSSSTEELPEVCREPRGGRVQGEEGFRAVHLSPTPAALCSRTCLVSAPPRSSLLLSIPLPTLPASAQKLSCGCLWFTFSLSQPSGLSVPGPSLPGMLSLEPRSVAKTWPHLSPPRPTCKGRSVLLVPPST